MARQQTDRNIYDRNTDAVSRRWMDLHDTGFLSRQAPGLTNVDILGDEFVLISLSFSLTLPPPPLAWLVCQRRSVTVH